MLFAIGVLMLSVLALVRAPVEAYRLFGTIRSGWGGLSCWSRIRALLSMIMVVPLLFLGLWFLVSVVLMIRDMPQGGPNGLSEVGMIGTVFAPLYLLFRILSRGLPAS
jgi:hypothetical protein